MAGHRRVRIIIFITAGIFIIAAYNLSGQTTREEAPPLKERLFFGGSFGLQFGTYTDIEVSPVIGLWLLPRMAVAAGPDYRFYKDPDYSTDIYGGSAYMQFVVIQDINSVVPLGVHAGIFLHAENELLSLQTSFWKDPPYKSDRFYINTLLAGGGISQHIGRRSSLDMMILWALNVSQYNLYSNPEIRVSFIF
ncbi:MAG: hypothetical protein QG576_775 [Bacteroidota bacterium]|nr:hypothetical protein [Bacteroidota bacterium]